MANSYCHSPKSTVDQGAPDSLSRGLFSLWNASGNPPFHLQTSRTQQWDAAREPETDSKEDKNEFETEDDEGQEIIDTSNFSPVDLPTPIIYGRPRFLMHIRQLYPTLRGTGLDNDIARHQMVRYKRLSKWTKQHDHDLRFGTCTAGPRSLIFFESVDGELLLDVSYEASISNDSVLKEAHPKSPETKAPIEFECPLCYCVKTFPRPSDWIKHAYEDIRPFSCTLPHCPKVNASFKSKADWIQHEDECRSLRREYWTDVSTCQFCGEKFNGRRERIDHVASHLRRISFSILKLNCRDILSEGSPEPDLLPTLILPDSSEYSTLGSSCETESNVFSLDRGPPLAADSCEMSAYGIHAHEITGFEVDAFGRDVFRMDTLGMGMDPLRMGIIGVDEFKVETFGMQPLVQGQETVPEHKAGLEANEAHDSRPSPKEEFESQSTTTDVLTMTGPIPCPSQSEDSEYVSTDETETDSSDDEYRSLQTQTCSLLLSKFYDRKPELFKEIMKLFWSVYNKNFLLTLTLRGASTLLYTTGGPNSSSTSQCQHSSSVQFCSATSNSSRSSKRKSVNDEDQFPPDDSGRERKRPSGDATSGDDERPAFRLACPFRKHNPQKYNMHDSVWRSCAISSFDSVARTKEHLCRKHMAPIQCVRCWIHFRNQEDLDIHLASPIICDIRAGTRAEGITSDMVTTLRRRKKLDKNETEVDRWRRIYRMLFPNEEVPSPFFEPILDDRAQFRQSETLSIMEVLRRQMPQLLTRRLEVAILNMNLDNSVASSDFGQLVRETFIGLIPRLVNEAIDDTLAAHQRMPLEEARQSNAAPTPPPSSIPDSSHTPHSGASSMPPQFTDDSPSSQQQAVPIISQDPQHNASPATLSNLNNTNTILISLEGQESDDSVLAQLEDRSNLQNQVPLFEWNPDFDWEETLNELGTNSQSEIE